MNSSYSLYPSLQAPPMGLYPMQPGFPATMPAASTPTQLIVNIGHSSQPSSVPHPAAYMPQPAPSMSQPAAYMPQPAAHMPQLAAHMPQPAAHMPQPAAHMPQPAAYMPQPTAYMPQPAVYSPQPVAPQPPQASYHPVPVPVYPAALFTPTGGSSCLYPTLNPSHVSNPKQDSKAAEPSSTNSPLKSSQDSNVAQLSPTVKPITPFNPLADAKMVRKALKSGLISVDKRSIIYVLAARSNRQRLEIASHYQNIYEKNLITTLQNEFTIAGHFLDVMKAMLLPLPAFLAAEVHQAITGWGSHERTLVEILCTASTVELDAIKAAYKTLFGQHLEKDLVGEKCGQFSRLLASMLQVRRPENDTVDEVAAIQDAQSLVNTGLLKMNLVQPSFISILSNRSYAHLRLVFKAYEQISGKPLEFAVSSQFGGDLKTGLMALIQSIEDRAGFFADRIYDATSSVGSKDKQLIRVIVSRSEIDLQAIKESYLKRYGKRVDVDINATTDGHYRKMLLALVGGYQ